MCNNDLTLKPKYTSLERLKIVKYMFYIEFYNHEWTRITLSRVCNDLLWLGDAQILIDNDLIQCVMGLRNEGCNPI